MTKDRAEINSHAFLLYVERNNEEQSTKNLLHRTDLYIYKPYNA